jgi:excisionase family DNA binding protein
MTVPEAAEFLRCRRQRVDDLLSSGRLRRYKDGRRTLVSRAELEEYLGWR